MHDAHLETLRCSDCRHELAFQGNANLTEGLLVCGSCGAKWPVEEGLPRMYRDAEFTGSDRFMRALYEVFHHVHDPAVRLLIPLLQLGGTEHSLRSGYMRRLELDAFEPGDTVRILEVGVGTGANLPWLRRSLPRGVNLELWGLDPSPGMLGQCIRSGRAEGVNLLLGDAHALPFDDDAFDRVFHVGGINGFRDPAGALKEMARVAKPGTPIVAVDEQRDPETASTLYHRIGFRLVTFYDRTPWAPVHAVPAAAQDVETVQVSPFFYCMRFRMPA